MTLILSLATPEFVMQVSDRRLSKLGVPLDVEANKAIVWCNHGIVGFTGVAFVDHRATKPTDDWITDQLFGRTSFAGLVEGIADAADRHFADLRFYDKRLAVVVVGWAPQPPSTAYHLMPCLGLVSNFHDPSGRQCAQQNVFTRIVDVRPPVGWSLHAAGQMLKRDELAAVTIALDRLSAETSEPPRFLNLLAQVIRRVADRSAAVGHELMGVCIPRAAAGAPMMLTERRGTPNLETPTFFHLRSDRDHPDALGPVFVCGDQGFGDIELEYLNESGSDARISARILGPGSPS